ncbi:TrmB family transcriptional regulator [Mycobacterium avium]|uniref:TrmB family transcriptional regulator n=1 Tax=Mycobacterium avium TaxID=1764 RepID=UPI00111C8E43|nr:TrmB family transcriptional regulator [Mycobacterium avium]
MPDRFLLERLQAEHQHGTWIGTELLPIANAVRQLGGDEEDYLRWVQSSNLWNSYAYSTSDRAADQRRSLEGAWRKSATAKPFDLEENLTDLEARVRAYTRWPNPRTASRDRAVALAFIRFCLDRNCYTRTISCYELAKYTPGLAPATVNRALHALLGLGLLRDEDRTDRRPSKRSTRRYRLNLYWAPRALRVPSVPPEGNGGGEIRSTCKSTLSQEPRSETEGVRDLWSRRGLGPGTYRVWEVMGDEAMTAREIASLTGQSDRSVRDYAAKLADAGLAGIKPGRPRRYFKAAIPLDLLEEVLECHGYLERQRQKIEILQGRNREQYPGTYNRVNGDA